MKRSSLINQLTWSPQHLTARTLLSGHLPALLPVIWHVWIAKVMELRKGSYFHPGRQGWFLSDSIRRPDHLAPGKLSCPVFVGQPTWLVALRNRNRYSSFSPDTKRFAAKTQEHEVNGLPICTARSWTSRSNQTVRAKIAMTFPWSACSRDKDFPEEGKPLIDDEEMHDEKGKGPVGSFEPR